MVEPSRPLASRAAHVGSSNRGDAIPLAFPDDFIWGAATAAYQIEGAVDVDGRGPSIWDVFCKVPGAVRNGDSGDVACDHYHRLEEDLDLIAGLGLDAYRFSIAWPRVQPTGRGAINRPGLDFYRRLVDGLRESGVAPVATLYHWDLPQALEDDGGWQVRVTAERFADYAAIVGDALGDGVERWITLNEPWCSAWLGYGTGQHAPGISDIGAACAATHHLLLGHGLATAALRAASPGVPVGIALNLAPVDPATDDPHDVDAARRVDGNLNRLFLGPLFSGRYPTDMLDHYSGVHPGFAVVRERDLQAIAAPLDFLGVNFYRPQSVVATGRESAAFAAGLAVTASEADSVSRDLGALPVHRPDRPLTHMGWEVDSAALTRLLVDLHEELDGIALYVTENGASYADYVGHDGQVHDPDRIAFLESHLRAVHDARAAGVDVRGYFVWSLMDNFEWSHGYNHRFGLIWVDYPTRNRRPKDSYTWYARHTASGFARRALRARRFACRTAPRPNRGGSDHLRRRPARRGVGRHGVESRAPA